MMQFGPHSSEYTVLAPLPTVLAQIGCLVSCVRFSLVFAF